MLKFALPPSATHPRRLLEWTPTETGGLLVIRLYTPSGRMEADVYGVEEQTPPAPGIREWLLLNATDPTQRDTYEVRVGRVASCTCTAGQVKRHECKHIAALKAITGERMRTRTHKGVSYTVSEAHPAAERYDWFEEADLQSLSEDIAENGQHEEIIRLDDGRIVDGRNRELACLVAGIVPRYETWEFKDDAEIAAFVWSKNGERRHHTPEEQQKRRAERVPRVAAMRAEGKSLRAIAEAEGISESQVREDVKAATAQGCAVETPDGKTTGKDGKKRSATKPKAKPAEEVTAPPIEMEDATTVEIYRDMEREALEDGNPEYAAEIAADRKELEARLRKSGGKPVPKLAPGETEAEAIDPREALISRINKLCTLLDGAKATVKELAAEPFGKHIHAESVIQQIEAARKTLWQSRPTEACNCVKGGKPAQPQCKACFGSGHCPASRVLKGSK